MAALDDLMTTPHSGLNYIDALLGTANWNYITTGANLIRYTFSISEGIPAGQVALTTMNASQKAAVHSALDYVHQLTGINFVETASGTQADLHFAMQDLSRYSSNSFIIGGWTTDNDHYAYTDNQITEYTRDAYVFLDNKLLASWYADPSPGTRGYEDLLHEIGHALGLKHPFQGDIQLPAASDKSSNSLMSYTHDSGPYSTFQAYDIAALNFLYGGDGLGGKLGIATATDCITGTPGNDTLQFSGIENAQIDGGKGSDLVSYSSKAGHYQLSQQGSALYLLKESSGASNGVTLRDIERLNFSDLKLALDLASSQSGGKTVLLIGAAFGLDTLSKHPDYVGVGLQLFDAGYTLGQVAQLCLGTGLVSAPDNTAFVSAVWKNVVGTSIDSANLNYFVGQLQGSGGSLSQAALLELAASSQANAQHVDLVGLAKVGLAYL